MDIHKKHVIISCTLLFLGIIFPFTISAQKSFKNSFQDLDPIQAPLIPHHQIPLNGSILKSLF